ncbi:hypothetical protein M758_6G182100 [Ceratodon purpureus]|nr:hypothetical protein M758_6G182100 [Ceratodon purpureus]
MEFEDSGIESSECSIFCLGQLMYSTLSKRVEDFYDVLFRIARQWSVDFAVQKFLNVMVLLNPRLNCHQQAHLKPLLNRALDQLLWQQALDPRVMRGLVALACPNQETTILFGYLMEVISGIVYDISSLEEDSMSNIDIETETSSLQMPHEKARVSQCLYRHYSLEPVYVAAMPSPVRRAVLAALKGSMEVPLLGSGLFDASSQDFQHTAPICSITLEALLCPDGTIAPDVVAVIQRSTLLNKQHAFLYKGRALFEWLGSSPVPKNPATRTMVLPTDVYRLS